MRRTVLRTLLGGALAASALAVVPSPAVAGDPPPPPPNDNFASATVLPAGGGTFTGDNNEATVEPGEPSHAAQWGTYEEAYHSVWWSWTPTVSGVTEISTCDSDFDTRMAVYTGSAVNNLHEVASNTNGNRQECSYSRWAVTSFYAEAGTTYRVAVDTEAGFDGNFDRPPQGVVNLVLTAPPGDYNPPPPDDGPANDDFADAAAMPFDGATYAGTNEGAGKETGEPSHAGVAATSSIWYEWTAASSGYADITTCGSDFDTRIGVYTGSAVDALTPVASNEDGNDSSCASPKFAVVAFAVTEGTTYRFAVDTSGSLQGGVTHGTALITLTPHPGEQPPPTDDDDTNPSTTVTEAPYEFRMLRLKPLCSEEGSKSINDCPRKATNLKFYSAEPYQNWTNRQDSVRRWVDKLRSSGADINLVMVPKPSSAMDGAVMKYLLKHGKGGEILTQNVTPREMITTTADDPLLLKVSYFDPAIDQEIREATLAALDKAGKKRPEVRSPCDFIATDAKPHQILEVMNREMFASGTMSQKQAGAILKKHGCGYEVAEYIEGPGFTTDVVLDVVGVDKKRDLIQLKVALPVAQDFALVISEEPEFAGTNILGLGLDGRLTASATQVNRITVQVLERSTGRLVPGAKLEFWDHQGRPVTETTNSMGEWTFTSLMKNPDKYSLKASVRGANGATMVGFRSIEVVDRKGASFTTMAGRTMSWNGSAYVGTQADIDRARQLEIVPGNLGTGLAGPATAPPQIQQITAAVPSGGEFVTGQHNAVHLPNDTNYLVGSASGLVTIGGGYDNQVAAGATDARRSWTSGFQQAVNWLGGILTGLQEAFESGEGTVTEKTSVVDRQSVATSLDTLVKNGAQPTGGGLISDKGLGLIGQAGGNLIGQAGGNVISTGGLNLRDAQGNLIGQAGGNLISDKGLGRVGHRQAPTGMFIGSGNVISLEKSMMPVYGGNVIATR